MRKKIKQFYLFLESIPERLYPFASEIEGRWERGINSYKVSLEKAWKEYGDGRNGYKINVYRSTCHMIGSIFFLIFATLISNHLLGSENALYVMVAVAISLIFLQEFFSHPKRYSQLLHKSFLDWFTWAIPMLIYVFFIY